tara:strand:- start:3369 stop:4205 length:837 start_codon:yes stop_codon:yes gene_type:complete
LFADLWVETLIEKVKYMSTNAMHVAKTGLNAQQVRMQIISNNLANVNTNGFKRDRANFESLLYQVIRNSGAQTSVDTELTSGFSVGTGVNIVSSNKLHSQGSIVSTDNSLDLAIDGGGFFQVLLPDGQIVYTRNGAFARNNEGVLTTSSGFIIQPEIVIPAEATKINVSSDGIVSVQIPEQVDAQEVGQLQLADFQNRTGLQPIGENFYIETTASGPPVLENPFAAGFGKLIQGALESSNVNVIQELVDMIETQRAYEVNSKAITSVDEMLRFVSNNL